MENLLPKLVNSFADAGPLVLLESQSAEHPWSRKSYFAARPRSQITARGKEITVRKNGEITRYTGNPWAALQQFRRETNSQLFGYLGYDLKNHLEELHSENPDPVQAPDMFFMRPGFLLEWNHRTGEMNVPVGQLPLQLKEETLSEGKERFTVTELHPQVSREKYLKLIAEAKHRIKEGDIYEINLSHCMAAGFSGDPFSLYKQMRKVGPVPFGAYLKLEDLAVCCQSPERFLRREGSRVISQPIKGTAPRDGDTKTDASLRRALQSSRKERAENLMIVDLVRNDLNRIARNGSVKVPELFEIQSFETVHQMVSTIEAETIEADPVRILKSCFPMGSMTGAPKISAMESIEELEQYRRGIYSGAIGYIKADGDFDFNVVIRSALVKQDRLYNPVGGAITGDSIPDKEWEETLVKARALQNAIL